MSNANEPAARLAQFTPARRALLEKWKQGKSGGPTEIVSRRDAGPVPLSFQQQRLWFLHQLEPDASTYTMSVALQLTGDLQIQALEHSLTLLVQRHEPLRTCFPTLHEQPVQHIVPPTPLRLPLQDLSFLTEEARQKEIHLLLKRQAQRPISLAAGPLFRQSLLRLAPQRHMLILTMHHTIYDGLSLNILLRELAAFYSAHLAGATASLPPLSLNYADYAIWQREWLQGKEQEALTSYWKQQLQSAPVLLELPTDRPRQPIQTHNGARLRVPMSDSLTGRLKSWSKQEGVTLFMLTIAAFQILLARYSGQRDFVLGAPIANRPRPEFEPLIGFFANTLALRTSISGNPTFRSFLQQTRKVALEAYAHQEIPFERLVEILQPPRSLSYNPLVQIVFSLDELVIPTLEVPGLKIEIFPGDSGLSQFDLTFSLIDMNESIEINAQYNTDLFDKTTIARLIEHYLHLLEASSENPEQRVYELPLLLKSEQERILFDWHETGASYPDTRCIHELFEEQAQRTPDALAVALDEYALSYQELNKRADQLARYLHALGVGPDHLVGLCLARSLETFTGLLGILKAGGAYIPLDPTYPAQRLEYLLADSQVSIILTQRGLPDQLVSTTAHIINLEPISGRGLPSQGADVEGRGGTCPRPETQIRPDHLAYIIYTSGSTGRPKGVAVPHRGLCNLISALRCKLAVTPGERVLQFASMNFDASVLESFVALAHGACLVLASHEALMPGPPLVDTLQRQAITITLLPPSTLAVLPTKTAFPTLRVLLVGGDACTAQLVAAWAPGREFFNAYGPTEVSVCATLARCEDGSQTPPLGRPLPNIQLYILNAALQPAPPGASGEIYLGGVGLARGYLGRPELTADRFIPHPFSSQPGARLYRTGDLGRYDAKGNVEFLGRSDSQVKLRGFRVESGEIEAVLRELPAIQDAVVLVHVDRHGEKQLVAYVVPGPDNSLEVSVLRRHLRARLPEYMIPAKFVLLTTLPITPNGKIDHRALPSPAEAQVCENPGYHAPQSDLERTISDAWQEVLQVAQVGRHDNFFDLGGHSLAMVRIHNQLKAQLTYEIALLDLFQYPTVDSLARYLSEGASVPTFQASQARASARNTTFQRQQAFRRTRKQDAQESESLHNA